MAQKPKEAPRSPVPPQERQSPQRDGQREIKKDHHGIINEANRIRDSTEPPPRPKPKG